MAIAAANRVDSYQTLVVAEQTLLFAERDALGALTAMIDVPANSTVVGGYLIIDTASDEGTAETADVGDGGDPNRYTASPIDLTTAGATALTVTGYRYTEADNIHFEIVVQTAGDATEGVARLVIEYIVTGRGSENQS